MVALKSLVLRELEAEVGAGADAHQSQERGTEFRHGQAVVDRRDENDSQHDCPHEYLKAVKAIAGPVRENVPQQSAADTG